MQDMLTKNYLWVFYYMQVSSECEETTISSQGSTRDTDGESYFLDRVRHSSISLCLYKNPKCI